MSCITKYIATHWMQWCEAHRHCTLRVVEKLSNAVTNPEQGGLDMALAQESRCLRHLAVCKNWWRADGVGVVFQVLGNFMLPNFGVWV